MGRYHEMIRRAFIWYETSQRVCRPGPVRSHRQGEEEEEEEGQGRYHKMCESSAKMIQA
jgi:hypothetical protein